MIFRVTSKRSRLGFSSVLKTCLSNLAARGPDAKFTPLPKFSEVGKTVIPKIEEAGLGHYVHVTGQYYDHDASLTRNVVMKINEAVSSDEFHPELILDAALTDSEMKILTNLLVDSRNCRYISTGEIDSVGSEDWHHGYVMSPCFSIFNRNGVILKQHHKARELVQLYSRPGFPIQQKVWLKDVENVYVNLSPRPWTTQTLGVRTLSEQVTVLKFDKKLDVVSSEDDVDTVEPSHEELGEIMIKTEWVVKAAAQLVFVASKNRYKNNSIPLYVPRVVQADLNPWVAMRNSLWQNSMADKLQNVQDNYIP